MSVLSTLLPTAATPAVSAWFTVESGATVKLALLPNTPTDVISANVSVEQKEPAGTAVPVAGVTLSARQTALLIQGPGTYRVNRPAGSNVGVFLEA